MTPSSNINYQNITHSATKAGHSNRVPNDLGMRPKHYQLFIEIYSFKLVLGVTFQEAIRFVNDCRSPLTVADAHDNVEIANVIMTRVGKGHVLDRLPLADLKPVIGRTIPL